MIVLAGDIGGTNTRLLLADMTTDGITVLFEKSYVASTHDGLQTILDEFLDSSPLYPEQACLAVAGPVNGRGSPQQNAKITNLPWELDSTTLSKGCAGIPLRLINDFEAIGYGLSALTDDDLLTIQTGSKKPDTTIALIGAGTGLGQAYLTHSTTGYTVHPTEGGHVDFSPTTDQEQDLLNWLRNTQQQVSWENILSGSGLIHIVRFLYSTGEYNASNEFLTRLSDDQQAAGAISDAAKANNEPLAVEARRLFMRLYGRQTANFALTTLATGGIYLAGGIAAKNIDAFNDPEFLQGFHMKATMQNLINDFPISVIRTERTGLIGAAHCATQLTE